MKFKKLKYNIICLILVGIVVSAVFLKLYFVKEDVPDSEIVDMLPDDNNSGDINDGSNDYEDFEEEEYDPNQPSTKYPLKYLNYALNKSAGSKSYQSALSHTIRTTLSLKGVNIDTKSYVNAKMINMGKVGFEEISFKADELAKPYTPDKNLRINYWDGTKHHRWVTEDWVYDINQATYSQGSTPYYQTYYDRLLGEPFNFQNGCGSASSTNQINKKTGKKEVCITVIITNQKGCPEQFMRSYKSFSGSINFKSVTQSIKFVIFGGGF